MIMYERVEEHNNIDPQVLINKNNEIQEQFYALLNSNIPGSQPGSQMSQRKEDEVVMGRGESFMDQMPQNIKDGKQIQSE